MSFELDYVRIRWKQKPDFTGAAFPFGCVYERGISRPVIRGMVEGRVRALPAAYEILCPDCLTPEDPKVPQAQQKHAPGCLRAPKVAAPAPAPAPALERDTVPGGPALPREMAPADLLAELEQPRALDWSDADPTPAPAAVQRPTAADVPQRPGLGSVDVRPVQRGQQKGRGR